MAITTVRQLHTAGSQCRHLVRLHAYVPSIDQTLMGRGYYKQTGEILPAAAALDIEAGGGVLPRQVERLTQGLVSC